MLAKSISESKDRTSQLGTLRKALWDARANWNDIGIDLKITTGTLKVCLVRYSVFYIAVSILACMLQICMSSFWSWNRSLSEEECSSSFMDSL